MAKNDKKNWKNFERLVYEYVTHLYEGFVTKEQKWTDETHDSGYDGIWVILPKNHVQYQTILMEAKYRKSQVSLPLHDCAKAIIIAFNLAANKLYIGTNIAFAPQTKEQIKHFNCRSDLEIVCINKSNLISFVKDNKEYLKTKCELDESFLEEFENITDIMSENLDDTISYDIAEEYLEDTKRKEIVSSISSGFIFFQSCYMLTGNEGVGKSVLCKNISEKLFKMNFDVCKIDMALCTSSRVLYLKILEAIWGISLNSILDDTEIASYIDQLIFANSDAINETISSAVKHILATSYYEYEGAKDYYLHELLMYLDIILKIRQKNFRLAIFFENLNVASEEVLDFLLQIINCLKINHIRILLEVRTPFLLDAQSQIEKSKFYYEQFKSHSDKVFILNTIEHNIATAYIKRTLQLSQHACERLAGILGDNLLDIQSALQVLRGKVPLNEELESMTDAQLDEYWYSCGISTNTIIFSLISKLRTIPILSSIFEVAYLFRGEIPCQALNDIYGEKAADYINEAINSTVFEQAQENLVCKHLRFLWAIKETSNQYEYKKLAKKLLPFIQAQRECSARYPYIELDLLYALERTDDVPYCTLNVMSLLMDAHQYRKALAVAVQYINFYQRKVLSFSYNYTMLLKILLQALLCIRELHADNEETYNFIYEIAKKYILLDNPDYLSNKDWYIYCLFIWHKEFILGKFEVAFRISETLLDELEQANKLFAEDEDYSGQVYNAHGLSIKMVNSGVEAEAFFKKGVEKYPNSYYAKAALLSQEGNRLLKTNPLEASQKYIKLLDTVKGKVYPFQEMLHTRVDVAMASFLAENYDIAIEWAKDSSEVASSLGIYIQKGRALNILGCCQAAQGKYDTSIKNFKDSHALLSLSTATIYVWRARLNWASVLLCTGNKEAAFPMLNEVLEILKKFFIEKIEKDIQSVPYKSFLLILMYFYLYYKKEESEVNEIIANINSTTLMEDFLRLSKNENWKETFHEKVKCCNAIVLVTG